MLCSDERPHDQKITNIATSPSHTISTCAGDLHGTAVAQAIADVAPNVSLYISNAAVLVGNGPARIRFKDAVDWMIRQGVDVINYSGSWPFSEGLGDGIPRNTNDPLDAIDTAVAAGIIWVNSVGNRAQRIWRGPFGDTTTLPDNFHDFVSNDDRNYITFGSGTNVTVEMRWDESWGLADCDLDLRLYREDASGNIYPTGSGRDSQLGRASDRPKERILNYAATASGKYYLRIEKRRWARCSDVDWVQLYVWTPHTLEHSETGYSIGFPGESKNNSMLAVGAAKHSTTNTIQPYSSRGPTNDGRKKPEIVGADCGQAKYYSEVDPGANTANSNSDCWFWGTSQAAPHVAGLAALVKDRSPDYSPEQIAIYLKENAEQRLPPAPDNTHPNNIWGHGFALLPNPADTASLSPAPSQITVGQSATFTLSTNVPASTGVRAAVNYPGDTGNLAVSSLGADVCPGSNDYRLGH